MKAHTARQQPKPRGVSLRLVLLAFASLIVQPAHWTACYLSAFSDAHSTPSASHQHAEQNAAHDELTWNPTHQHVAHQHVAHQHVAHQHVAHQHEHAEAATHTASQHNAHGETFVITPHCVDSTHHHHLPDCVDSHVTALSTKTARQGVDSQGVDTGLFYSSAVAALPVFRFDAAAGHFTRAGPPDTTATSVYLASSLLGRAPPLSV